VAQLGEHRAEVERDDLAGRGRRQAARAALEQRDAEARLQVAQRGADGRLRQLELARDRGHVALLGEARDDREAAPFRIDANSVSTSVVARMPPRATSWSRAVSNSRSMRCARRQPAARRH
jgi:hypothetical protein